jgi:hypothetical protein
VTGAPRVGRPGSRALTADGYPVGPVLQSVCACGGATFRLDGDREEGCARRTCLACGRSAFLGDSGEFWADARPARCICPECAGEAHEVGVGFSLRADGDVRWLTVGQRCVRCGVLGSFVDWKIDYVTGSSSGRPGGG